MAEMIKNETIERAFRRYFDGAPAPHVDLTAAKAALHESARRQKAHRRGRVISLLSAAACLFIAVIFAIYLLPSMLVTRYSITEAQTETVGYTELKERYADAASMFSAFSLADNASAEYTLYAVDGKDVLLRADLKFLSGVVKMKATVQMDLTGGKYVADELKDYNDLEDEANGYRYERKYINGEYVSRAYYKNKGSALYIDVSSHSREALGFLMKVLMH